MAGIRCEICGGSDLIKEKDLFVCQRCKTKYSLEDARKLFVDDGDDERDNSAEEIKRAVSDMEEQFAKDMTMPETQRTNDEALVPDWENQNDDMEEGTESSSEFSQNYPETETDYDWDASLAVTEYDWGETDSETEHPDMKEETLALEESTAEALPAVLEEAEDLPVSPGVQSDSGYMESSIAYCAICHKSGDRDKDFVKYDQNTLLCFDCNQKVKYAQGSSIDRNVQREFFYRMIKEKNASDMGKLLISSIYDETVEDFVRRGPSPVRDSVEAPSYPMKWHKVLMVLMIIGGILTIGNGINVMVGSDYMSAGWTADRVYAVFPGMKACDLTYGICGVALGIFEFIVRNRLNNLRSNGPRSLMTMYVLSIASSLIYTAWASSVLRVNVFSNANWGFWVRNVLLMIINGIYYSKRKELFVN